MEGRLIKKAPVVNKHMCKDGFEAINYNCPSCNKMLFSTKRGRARGERTRYCCDCGQALTWKGIKIETYWPSEEMD